MRKAHTRHTKGHAPVHVRATTKGKTKKHLSARDVALDKANLAKGIAKLHEEQKV